MGKGRKRAYGHSKAGTNRSKGGIGASVKSTQKRGSSRTPGGKISKAARKASKSGVRRSAGY